MGLKSVIYIVLYLISIQISIAQTEEKKILFPSMMVEVNHSNRYLSTSGEYPIDNNSTINANLKYEYGVDFLSLFNKNSKSKRNVIYAGAGVHYLKYEVNRLIVEEHPSAGGHFPTTYTYIPNTLSYNLGCVRFQLHLNHYIFFKKIILFQKLGLSYNSFIKKNNSESEYVEKSGSSYPTKDPAFITIDNPEGWHYADNYTYTKHQDMDIYKNGLSAFYKFGFGYRIKRFIPFLNVEFSDVLGNFKYTYIKGQIGLNYSFN